MLKCDYRRHDSLASGQTISATQKRRHVPSPATIGNTDWLLVSENELSEELPEAEPRLSVSERILFVVTFVHIVLSLSCGEVLQLPLRSPAT